MKKSKEEIEKEINDNIEKRIIEPIVPSVELIQRTENMKYLIWRAARVCYSIKVCLSLNKSGMKLLMKKEQALLLD